MTESIPRPNTIHDALALLSSIMDRSAPNFLNTICKIPEPAQSLLDVSISDASSADEHITCIICKETVPYRILYQHAYDHLQPKPFLCTCGAHFRNASDARRHRHGRAVDKIHLCSFCDRHFGRKYALKAHYISAHGLAESYIEELTVNADTSRMRPIGHLFPTPSSYETSRHISGPVGAPPPQITFLKVKDIDGKNIDVPLYQPLLWQELCSLLIKKQVLAKQHLSSGDCVVYTPDGRVLFGQEWDNWIALAISSSNDNIPAQLQVELRIVRKSCCEKLSERDRDVCNGCGTPLIEMDVPVMNSPDAIELVPIPSTLHIETTNVVPDESYPIATSVEITFNSENALVRRRKQQPSSEESGEEQRSSPLQNEDQNMDSRNNTLHRVVDVLWTLYLYLIKPPFIALPCTLNDRFHSENLDFYLSFLRTWILGINTCLLGGAWAVSDLKTVSQSPTLQIFMQLSASFAFFGIVFGLLLSYNIGIMEEKDSFVQWVNQNRGNRGSESQVSVWNSIVMLSLPLTWTTWAILNTVVFILLYAWIIDPYSDPSIAMNIPGAFTSLVITWSVFYVYMIQREVSRRKLYLREEVLV